MKNVKKTQKTLTFNTEVQPYERNVKENYVLVTHSKKRKSNLYYVFQSKNTVCLHFIINDHVESWFLLACK